MPLIRVFIADDHAVLRAGLKLLIGAQTDMVVVGEAGDGPEAVLAVQSTMPDVVLLDLSMPGEHGTRTIERLGRVAPAARVLVLTMHDDPSYLRAALEAGASGYLVKQAADVDLLTAIRAVHRGGNYVNLTRPGEDAAGGARRNSPAHGQRGLLSRREAEVLRLLAQGYTNQEAGGRLSLSVKTIETHRKRLSDKLGLKGRAQLYRFAVEAGLVDEATALPSGK